MEVIIIAAIILIGTPIMYAINPNKFIECMYAESEDWDND